MLETMLPIETLIVISSGYISGSFKVERLQNQIKPNVAKSQNLIHI